MALLQARPAQSKGQFRRFRIATVGVSRIDRCRVRDAGENRPMPGDTHLFNERLRASFDADFFANDLGLFPLSLIFILERVLRVEFLDIEVFDIGDGVGDAQAMCRLWPMTTPGVPGKLAPTTSMPGALRWHSYQIEGAACPRCGSLQRMGEPVTVMVPSTTQLLLAPSRPKPLNCLSASYCSSIPALTPLYSTPGGMMSGCAGS